MLTFLDSLRELTPLSVLVRLILALLFGGLLGLHGTRKQRAAGFRTYMLVCMGSALTMILSQYCAFMVETTWEAVGENPLVTDVSRFSAQVINGIGFLGAGTVLITGRQEVKGLTTAAGLWASACMGIAIGAGFYESVIIGFFLIVFSFRILPGLEASLIEHSTNINLLVEFQSINTLSDVISAIKASDILIYDIDIDQDKTEPFDKPNAVIMLHMNRKTKTLHTKLISDLSDIEGVYSIKEIF